MKHTHVTVLRNALGDCTNYGLSSRHTMLYLFDDCSPDEAADYCASHGISLDEALWVDRSPSCGREYIKAVPVRKKREGYIGPMSGGNFVYGYSSDKDYPRYSTLPDIATPIPIHDRYETPEEYRLMSM